MPYAEWKAKHQTEATPEQQAKLAERHPEQVSARGPTAASITAGGRVGGKWRPSPDISR